MPVLSIRRQDILLQNKRRILEELADWDVASALPPTDRCPQDRTPLLAELQSIDTELRAIGLDDQGRDITSDAEMQWEYEGYEE